MPDSPNPPGGGDVMLRVAHHALLSGLCQFIPVPFADDLVDRRVRKRMVNVLLDRRGRSFDAEAVKPLYAGPPKSAVETAGSVAKGLVMRPIKKLLRTVFFVATIRRAVLEAAEVLLLGHTLDRLLADGWFAEGQEATRLEADAARVERAVDDVMASPERRNLTRLVRRAVRLLRDEGEADPPDATAAVAEPEDVERTMTDAQRQRLDAASERLRGELDDAEGRSLLARLDAAIDRRLGGVDPR